MKDLRSIFRFILIVFFIVIAFNSCSPPVYHPTVVNTPLLSNKGEINAAAHLSVNGFEPQLAYAVTDNIGLMLNGNFNKVTDNDSQDYQRFSFVEGAGGYFGKIGKYGRYEAYGGFGYGNNNFYYYNEGDSYFEDIPYTKFFMQGSLGSSLDFIDAAFSPRFVWATVSDLNKTYTNMYIEPVITVKVGYKFVKFVIQGGFSFPIEEYNPDVDGRFHQPILFSIGLQGNFNKLYD